MKGTKTQQLSSISIQVFTIVNLQASAFEIYGDMCFSDNWLKNVFSDFLKAQNAFLLHDTFNRLKQ